MAALTLVPTVEPMAALTLVPTVEPMAALVLTTQRSSRALTNHLGWGMPM
jgi:hypothetical protein